MTCSKSTSAGSVIRFGTDGWRAIIAEDFTFENVKLLSQAVADYLNGRLHQDKKAGREGIVVGYDARFLSRQFAETAARIFASNGLKVWLADSFCPTPAISCHVVDKKAAGGVVITASHNPPEYNGYKFKGWYGGSATPDIVADIEKCLTGLLNNGGEIKESEDTDYELFSPQQGYLQRVESMLDRNVLAGYNGKIVFDMMHGSAQGLALKLAERYNLNVTEFRNDVNPSFEGVNPEPIECYLGRLREYVQNNEVDFALATDGDGDRIGALAADGSFISAHQIIPVLIKYLAEKRHWSGKIVKTITVSDIVRKVAKRHNRELVETPVGFKYIAGQMVADDILLGGEESGGIGLKNYLPERDGLMLGMLLIEACAAYGKPLGELVRDLFAEYGEHHYVRSDRKNSGAKKHRLMESLNREPDTIAGLKTCGFNKADGIKIRFADQSWAMFRASGTEPVLRIYCEAGSKIAAEELLAKMIEFAENI